MSGRPKVNLALQGGGAHGAFTWGVLDFLLEDGRIDFDGISGTSAGAVNAVMLADGFARSGRDGARETLRQFWIQLSRAAIGGSAQDIVDRWMSFWDVPVLQPFDLFRAFQNLASPYGFNPLNINPLRQLVEELVDFERLHATNPFHLFLSATNVRNGKIRIFTGADVTADAVMASACLPYLFQTVVIDGQPYWDGGFMGNPALFPFFTETEAADILLVQINPIERDEIPTGTKEILERMSEITFNASLLREFRAIDFVNRMLEEGRLDPTRYRRTRVHRIDAGAALQHFSASTKFDTSLSFFEELHRAGRLAAAEWLDRHFADIGVRETVDLRASFT